MSATQTISPVRMDEIRRSWPLLDAEVDDMALRAERMREAAAEQSLCGELRRAVHESGIHMKIVAERIGLDAIVFSEWLQGVRNLRSDVLDRVAQAVGATVTVKLHCATSTPHALPMRETSD